MSRVGVLGTGTVGRTVGSKLVEVGHEVEMGSRQAGNEKAVEWAAETGERASEGSLADAAAFGQIVVNATAGAASLAALNAAGAANLAGKTSARDFRLASASPSPTPSPSRSSAPTLTPTSSRPSRRSTPL